MDVDKRENIKLAKQVWLLYLAGKSKVSIAETLNMQRTDVNVLIKYTTQDMFLSLKELQAIEIKN